MEKIITVGLYERDIFYLQNIFDKYFPDFVFINNEIGTYSSQTIQNLQPAIVFLGNFSEDDFKKEFCSEPEAEKQINSVLHILVVEKGKAEFQKKGMIDCFDAILTIPFNETECVVLLKTLLRLHFYSAEKNNPELKKISLSLEQCKTQLKEYQKIGKMGSWVFDLNTGETTISEESYRIYGLDAGKEYTIKELQKVPLAEYRPMLDTAIDDLISGKKEYDVEFKIERISDGKFLDIHSVAEFDFVTNRIIGIIQDVTEKNKAHNESIENRERWVFALESAGDGVWDWNIKTNEIFFSDRWKIMLGYSPEEIENEYSEWEKRVHPDDLENVKKELKRSMKDEIPVFRNEHRLLCRNGTYKWIKSRGRVISFDEKGNPLRFIGTHTDITSQKEIELQLETTNFAVDNADIGIFQFEKNGTIKYVNKSGAQKLGYTVEELKGMPENKIDKNIKSGNSQTNGELLRQENNSTFYSTYIRKDGTEYPVEITVNYFTFKNQTFSFSFVKDISKLLKATEAIKENEERFRSVFESANDAIISADCNGQIMGWNRGAEKIFGFLYNEIMGENIGKIIPQNYREEHNTWMKRVVNGGSPKVIGKTLEFEGLNKSGTVFPVELSLANWETSKGMFFTAIIRDISSRKDIEEKLRKSEEKFRRIFSNHSAIKLLIDFENGKIVEANEAAVRFYGWPVTQITKLKVTDLNFLSFEEFKNDIEQAVITHKYFNERKHRKADGSVCNVEVYNSSIIIDGKEFIHSIIHDITDKKIAERQLKLLSRSVEQSPVSIVVTNREGDIEYVNSNFSKVTGYTIDEVFGKKPNILKSGKQSQRVYQELWKTILNNEEWKGELLNRTKSGELIWEDVSISPVVDENDEITHFVAIKEDITVKKRLFEELIRAKERAEESDRLKSAFLANMSHEIRTPMNGILGFAELLKTPGLSSEEKTQFIQIIEESGQRMLNTINDLIDISKIESGMMKVELSDVDVYLQQKYLYNFFKQEASNKGLKFTFNPDENNKDIQLYTDKEKFIAISTNLIKNAIKYTQRGSIEFGYSVQPDVTRFFVKDTGIGISKQYFDTIFERFVQADLSITRPYEGAGLGLSITKAFVEMLGGKIYLESERGKGSVFYFELPNSLNKSKEGVKAEDLPMESASDFFRNLTILVAEDDEIGKKYLKVLFENKCKKLILAENGVEAVERFAENKDIDLILMDIKMPLMDGYIATKKIREFNRDVIVIAQTAFAMSGDEEKAIQAGCDAYITKPINKDLLFQIIKKKLTD